MIAIPVCILCTFPLHVGQCTRLVEGGSRGEGRHPPPSPPLHPLCHCSNLVSYYTSPPCFAAQQLIHICSLCALHETAAMGNRGRGVVEGMLVTRGWKMCHPSLHHMHQYSVASALLAVKSTLKGKLGNQSSPKVRSASNCITLQHVKIPYWSCPQLTAFCFSPLPETSGLCFVGQSTLCSSTHSSYTSSTANITSSLFCSWYAAVQHRPNLL